MLGRNGGPRRAGGGPAYIKVHESEIADDYPEPAMYERADEEADELLLAYDDAYAVAPEDLPRRLLSDFAVYNSEVRLHAGRHHAPSPRWCDALRSDANIAPWAGFSTIL